MANEFVVKNGLITPTVQLPGATSGTVTLSAPAVAGTTTIALPATAGTIVTTGDTSTVTNTMLAGSIANNKLANSTISGTALGGNLPTVTFNVSGTGLSGSATYNGTTASTFTVTSNATSANTVSTIVSRDASGNFSAGTITAALNGNASTASTLQTARTITLSGDVAGSVSFNGSTDVSITATIQPDSVALGTDTTGNYVATVAVSGTGLSVSGSGVESAAVTVTSNATNANTASTIVARDASGNFSAGTITAALSGNASTASALQTARTISLTGDVTGSVSFDGSGNAAIATTIQPDSVALGTDTTGNYMVNVTAGTGVSVSHTQGEGSTATVSIGQAVGTTDNVTFNNVTVNGTLNSDDITSTNISVSGNATITGNLTVSGTTTTVNSTTISIADANIELARNATTAAQANGAGLTVTGPTTAATLTYTSADDRWNFNKNLNVGTVFGALSGNASTATTLQTARTINGVSFDGSANISFNTSSVSEGTNLYYTDTRARAALSFTAGSGAYNSSTGVITIPTNTNQLTNGAGFITGYTETDTLATVTGRGASTSTRSTFNGGWTVPDTTVNYVGNFQTTDYSTFTFMSRAWSSVQGTNGLAYTFNTHNNAGGGGYGALQIYYGEGGKVEAPTSFRSPIFYDSNDTGFYVDPANTGTSARFAGQIVVEDGIRTRTSGYGSPYNLFALSDTYDSGTYYGIKYIEGNPDVIQVIGGNNVGLSIGMDIGDTTASSSLRAPIFYDSDDTTYYVNPNSTSSIVDLTVNNYLNVSTARYANAHGYAGNFVSSQSANSNYYPFSFTSTRGNHSWGIVARFRTDTSGDSDRPSIQFSSAHGDTRWNIGYCTGSDDNFRITQNMGMRNDGNNDGWGSARLLIDTSGNFYSYVSTRSPIFYDQDDTTYYLDPNSVSNIFRLNVVGHNDSSPSSTYGIQMGGGYAGIKVWNFNPNGSSIYRNLTFYGTGWDGSNVVGRDILTIGNYGGYVGIRENNPNNFLQIGSVGSSGYGANHIAIGDGTYAYAEYLNGGSYMGYYTTSGYFYFADRYLQAAGSMRAPIFYDSNDTDYLLDLNSTSNSALRIRGGALHGPNTTWGQYLYVGTNGSVDVNTATVAVTNGNLHLDAKNGYLIYLNNYSTSSYTVANQSIRSPIFYDLDDSDYYLSPHSSSNLNTFTDSTLARAGLNKFYTNRTAQSGNSDYWVGSQGWNESHTWDNVLNLLGSTFIDLWGTNRQHPQGNAYTHAQGLQVLHYRDGNSISYGWQMVGANSADDRWWLRGKWHTTYRSWYEIVLYGKNVGGDLYANRFIDSNNTAYYCDPDSTSNLVAITTGATGTYNTFNTWTNLPGHHGFYSSVHNSAHFYPNNGSYGQWKMSGSRGGWSGIEFAASNGDVTMMINPDSNTSGFHNNSYGWQMRWNNGTGYIHKNAYGGGTAATIWDSSNLTNINQLTNGPGYITSVSFDGLTSKTGGTGTYTTTGDFRAPIFYNHSDTNYYGDFDSTSRFNTTITNLSYFGTDTNKGHAQGYGTYSSQLHRIARITFDWDASYNSENHGIFSTDVNGNYSDNISINSFNDINLRIDSNDNNGASYVRFHQHTTGNGQFAYIGYDGSQYIAEFAGRTLSPKFVYNSDEGWRAPFIKIQDAAPSATNGGDLWWESDTGKLKIWYYDGNTSQWVDAFPIPDLTTYYSKAGGAISGPVLVNSSVTATGRIYADNGVTLAQNTVADSTSVSPGILMTNSDIRSGRTSTWTGNPGSQGKIQYHSARWYIVSDSASDRVVQFRRDGSDVAHIANDGYVVAPGLTDSNNSNFYLNPDGSSYLYNLELSGSVYFKPNTWIQFNSTYGLYWPNNYGAHIHANDLSTYTQIALRGSKNGYGGIYDQASGVNGFMYDGSGNGGIYREANGRWFQYHSVANNCTGFGTSSTNSAYGIWVVKGGYFDGRVDGTIFYDSSDAAYYLDPASTSTSLNVRGGIVSGLSGPSGGGGSLLLNGITGSLEMIPSTGSTAAEIRSAASNGIIFKANNSSVAQISSSGIISSSNITAYGSPSDRKLKENIEPLTNSLQKVMALEGVSFNWKKDTKEHTMVGLNKDIGLIAQNVQQVLPDLVREEEDGTLSLRDRGLVAVLIEAIKEQQKQIDELKAEVKALRG